MKTWYCTLLMLILYLAVFLAWQAFPGRTMFLAAGGATAALMMALMYDAARRGYFANRRDLILHAFLVLDVVLESGLYELFRGASLYWFDADGDIANFHNNHNFYACAAVFGLLIGGYHRWALRRERASAVGANPTTGDVQPAVQN